MLYFSIQVPVVACSDMVLALCFFWLLVEYFGRVNICSILFHVLKTGFSWFHVLDLLFYIIDVLIELFLVGFVPSPLLLNLPVLIPSLVMVPIALDHPMLCFRNTRYRPLLDLLLYILLNLILLYDQTLLYLLQLLNLITPQTLLLNILMRIVSVRFFGLEYFLEFIKGFCLREDFSGGLYFVARRDGEGKDVG